MKVQIHKEKNSNNYVTSPLTLMLQFTDQSTFNYIRKKNYFKNYKKLLNQSAAFIM